MDRITITKDMIKEYGITDFFDDGKCTCIPCRIGKQILSDQKKAIKYDKLMDKK